MFSYDLLLNAVTAGLLLGGFYAAVTVGVSISFGILDIVNIAHPAFIILGSYIAYFFSAQFGLDPILIEHHRAAGVLCARRRDLPSLLPLVRETRAGFAARARVLLRHPVHHRGVADPRVRRRLPLRPGGLHRNQPGTSAWSTCRCACWCRACMSLADAGGAAALPRRGPSPAAPSWRWRRTSWRCN